MSDVSRVSRCVRVSIDTSVQVSGQGSVKKESLRWRVNEGIGAQTYSVVVVFCFLWSVHSSCTFCVEGAAPPMSVHVVRQVHERYCAVRGLTLPFAKTARLLASGRRRRAENPEACGARNCHGAAPLPQDGLRGALAAPQRNACRRPNLP